MKTWIMFLVLIACSNCSPKWSMPSARNSLQYVRGSYVEVHRRGADKMKGELIAIDNEKMIVLDKSLRRCISLPLSEVSRFKVFYARPPVYWWSIPLFTLSTISHGFFSVLTFPANLIVTICVTTTGNISVRYTNNDISFHQLAMFARFPAGVPLQVDLGTIKD